MRAAGISRADRRNRSPLCPIPGLPKCRRSNGQLLNPDNSSHRCISAALGRYNTVILRTTCPNISHVIHFRTTREYTIIIWPASDTSTSSLPFFPTHQHYCLRTQVSCSRATLNQNPIVQSLAAYHQLVSLPRYPAISDSDFVNSHIKYRSRAHNLDHLSRQDVLQSP